MARIIAILSVLHLALCYFYLYFLYSGFGGDVVALFSATDVLSVGLGKILPFYLFFVPGLFFNHLWMIDKPFQLIDRQDFTLHEQVESSKLTWLLNAIILISPAMQLAAYFMGKPIYLLGVLLPLIWLFAWGSFNFLKENGIPDKYRLPLTLGFIGFLQVSTGAYAEGFSARHQDYHFFNDAPRACNKDNKVMFTVGDLFITARPDGTRDAISRDCELKLTFEKRSVTVPIHPI